MSWVRVFTNNGWRIFRVSMFDTFKNFVVSNAIPEPIRYSYVDLPGMCMTDRSHQKLQLDDLIIEIPSEDFETLYNVLLSTEAHVFPDDTRVWKFRGWMEGIYLFEKDREDLIRQMQEMLPAVKIIARQEHDRFTEALSGVRKTGAKVSSYKELRKIDDDQPN